MIGVKFADNHSYDDFDLILISKSIGAPAVKISRVDIPGADGYIDTTEYFGEVKYSNRALTFNFNSIIPQEGFLAQYTRISNAIHGKRLKIVLDTDPEYYYIGRCSISEFSQDRCIGKVAITCDCDPFKMRIQPTIIKAAIDGNNKTLIAQNARKTVQPTFTSDGPISFTFNAVNYSIESAGTFVFPEINLTAGNNIFIFSGNANIKIEYREGDL